LSITTKSHGPAVASRPAITAKIVHAQDISTAIRFNGLVYGFSGAGKTSLFASASDAGQKVLFIDAEAGSSGLSDRENIDILVPSDWDELGEAYAFLVGGEHEYTFVILDSLTEISRMSLERVVRDGKTPDNLPTLQQYGQSNDQVIRLVRAFRGLATSGNLGVGFTALAKEDKDDATGKVLVRPNLSPGVLGQVTAAVDMVGYLAQGTTKEQTQRILSLTNTGTTLGKFRAPASVTIPPQLVNPSMSDLLALQSVTQGGR
jgi:phage nucleotide-binding protein